VGTFWTPCGSLSQEKTRDTSFRLAEKTGGYELMDRDISKSDMISLCYTRHRNIFVISALMNFKRLIAGEFSTLFHFLMHGMRWPPPRRTASDAVRDKAKNRLRRRPALQLSIRNIQSRPLRRLPPRTPPPRVFKRVHIFEQVEVLTYALFVMADQVPGRKAPPAAATPDHQPGHFPAHLITVSAICSASAWR
jgi:hypothetical protein